MFEDQMKGHLAVRVPYFSKGQSNIDPHMKSLHQDQAMECPYNEV